MGGGYSRFLQLFQKYVWVFEKKLTYNVEKSLASFNIVSNMITTIIMDANLDMDLIRGFSILFNDKNNLLIDGYISD